MTTITPALLVTSQLLGSADSSLYSPVTPTAAQIGRAVFTNTTASATTITAGITAGGGLGASTTMISARTLAPGESYVSPELAGAVIPPNFQLHAFSSAANAVSVTVSGVLIQ